jgi:hypothetical protein
MYPDLKELLSAFNANRVKYLVVGAYAVSIHAQPRATKDMDIWIDPDAGNAKAAYAALAQFGAPLEGFTPADFAAPGSFFRMGRAPIAVDILSEISGVDFDSAWERRVEEVIDPATGTKANFLSRDDLVANKIASGRQQDLADVEAIQKAAESRAPQGAKTKPPETKPDVPGQ